MAVTFTDVQVPKTEGATVALHGERATQLRAAAAALNMSLADLVWAALLTWGKCGTPRHPEDFVYEVKPRAK